MTSTGHRLPATRGADRQALLVLLAAMVPALLGAPQIARASALVEVVLNGGAPAQSHFALVYVVVPIVALSACVLVLAPGLVLARLTGRTQSVEEWLFYGFLHALVLTSVVTTLVSRFVDLRGAGFSALIAGLTVAMAFGGARLGLARRYPIVMPQHWRRTALLLLLLWAVAYAALAPKLLWESFNGDGAGTFDSSRLLLHQALPFWDKSAGPVSAWPGTTSFIFTYPNAWFLRLFGEVAFSVRVPLLLYLPVLAAGVLLIGRSGFPDRPVPHGVLAGLGLSLVAYALTMAFSATYNPYAADIALPATQDTLLMIGLAGVMLSSLRHERLWLVLSTIVTYTSLPSGAILIAMWFASRFVLAERGERRHAMVGFGILVVTAAGAALLPVVLRGLGAQSPGEEYDIARILRYFAFLQFTEARRLLYVAIPSGFLPAIAVLAWQRQDRVARAVSLVAAGYFVFFFVQAYVSVHHFVPSMILPLVVACRLAVVHATPLWRVGWPVLAAMTLPFAVPQSWALRMEGHRIGRSILERTGDYQRLDPDVLRASTLLDRLFAYDWDPRVPAERYGGSPLTWLHHAQHGGEPGEATNYLLQRAAAPIPSGWTRIGPDSLGFALLVRDSAVWRAHQRTPAGIPGWSRWLEVPRHTLWRAVPATGGPRVISMVDVIEGLGIDMDPLLDRLGVERQ